MADRPVMGDEPMAAPPPPYRVPRDLADPRIREIGTWLEGVQPSDAREPGDPRVGPALRRLISAHGLAPALVRDPIAAPVAEALPDDLRAWLAVQDERNRRRIGRLLEELEAALRAFGAAGVAVMPLKGAILATRPGRDPFRRPMADLDLLVRPGDLEAARATLTALGYRRRLDRTRRPTHDTFELPGNTVVVTADGEHPDNPRRIELHTEVRRHLWGWVDDDELTTFLWAGASEATVLGELAMLPTNRAFAAHLAIHATSDLLLGRGRLLQWLDLAEVAGDAAIAGAVLELAPHPRLVYPSVRLAVRRLPGRFPPGGPAGLDRLEAVVPDRLVSWTSRVPLDTRAGLGAGGSAPGDASTLGERWVRWAPYRWRLVVAHGELPTAVAALRHIRRVADMGLRRPA
ncbi:MAG: nucleotidyltransferase family protein [Chloroflexi bacterium]|nr:nucleotidyltransferase family protein [Chloroflexota bacterium]